MTYTEKPPLGIMPYYIWKDSLEAFPPSYNKICNRQRNLKDAINRCGARPEWSAELIFLDTLKAKEQR
jgi:hypothetical protein